MTLSEWGRSAHAHHLVHCQFAHIHIDVAGNVRGQALDFHFAQHLVQNAALGLDADRNAQQLDAYAHVQNLIERNALQVDVDQLVLDRLALPVHDHGFGRGLPGNFHIENRVVAALGIKDPQNLLGIHFDGNRIVAGTIQHGRNLACDAHAARGVLVELALAGLGYDNFWHFVFSFLQRSGTESSL